MNVEKRFFFFYLRKQENDQKLGHTPYVFIQEKEQNKNCNHSFAHCLETYIKMCSFIFQASQSYFRFLLYPAFLMDSGGNRAGLTLSYLFTCLATLCTSYLARSSCSVLWADKLPLLVVRTGCATKPTSDQLCSWVLDSSWGEEAGQSRADSS